MDEGTAGDPPVSLRLATAADDGFLYDLYRDRRAEELAVDGLIRMQFDAQRVGYQAAFPDAEDWIVCVGAAPAGRLLWARRPGAHHVVDVAVLCERRGRGVGTAVLREVQAVAAGAGAGIELSVEARDHRVVGWYRRLGFTPVSTDGVHTRMTWAPGAWAELRRRVLAEPAFQQRLLATTGRAELTAAAVQLAGELGLDVAAEDVEAELAEARSWWTSQWI